MEDRPSESYTNERERRELTYFTVTSLPVCVKTYIGFIKISHTGLMLFTMISIVSWAFSSPISNRS